MVSAGRSTLLGVAVLLIGTSCSSADDPSGEMAESVTADVTIMTIATTELTTTELATTELPTTELTTTELATTGPAATDPATTDVATTAPPTEPTGAPGIDDDDEFCSAWARAIGIPQILTIAANFGGLDTLGMARLEVLSAAAVGSAVAVLNESLPAELEGERDIWFTRVLGPTASRAERAVTLLTAAGASAEDLADLGEAWLEALRSRDPSAPVPTVQPLDPALEAVVDDAAVQFEAQVTPWLDDPALVIDDSLAPAVAAYTREHCPDLSALGIGDDI